MSVRAREWVAVQFGGPEALRSIEADVPEPGPGHVAIDVRGAGDDPAAKQLVAGLYEEFGFDAVDIGGLDESWRVDAGQPAFVTRQNVAELTANVAKAKRGA